MGKAQTTAKPDLDALLATKRRRSRGRPREFEPAIAAARLTEQKIRANTAVALARRALSYNHEEEYRSLYEQAIQKVYAERGPLPGDPS